MPLNSETYKLAMKGGFHEAASNFWYHDVFHVEQAGIPVNRATVKKIMEHHFKSPTAEFPFQIFCASPSEEWDPLAHKGAWKRLSPEEPIHALLLACQRDIKAQSTELHLYRKLFLTCTYQFRVIPEGDARYWASFNMRELIKTESLMQRTPYQRIWEVLPRRLIEKEGKAGSRSSCFDSAGSGACVKSDRNNPQQLGVRINKQSS